MIILTLFGIWCHHNGKGSALVFLTFWFNHREVPLSGCFVFLAGVSTPAWEDRAKETSGGGETIQQDKRGAEEGGQVPEGTQQRWVKVGEAKDRKRRSEGEMNEETDVKGKKREEGVRGWVSGRHTEGETDRAERMAAGKGGDGAGGNGPRKKDRQGGQREGRTEVERPVHEGSWGQRWRGEPEGGLLGWDGCEGRKRGWIKERGDFVTCDITGGGGGRWPLSWLGSLWPNSAKSN